jgi:hypothetical protein
MRRCYGEWMMCREFAEELFEILFERIKGINLAKVEVLLRSKIGIIKIIA